MMASLGHVLWEEHHSHGSLLKCVEETESVYLVAGVPATAMGKGAALMPAPGTGTSPRGAAAVSGNGSLTTTQAATQMALCNGSNQMNGLVPVRTGLAWATLGELPFTFSTCRILVAQHPVSIA